MNNTIKRAFIGLCLVTAVLMLGFISLYKNESKILKSVSSVSQNSNGNKSPNTFIINGETKSAELSQYLIDKGIYSDKKDAACIAKWVTSKVGKSLPNLGALNKEQFRMPVDTLFGESISNWAGEKITLSIDESCKKLGITPKVKELYKYIQAEELPKSQLINFSSDSLICKKSVHSDSCEDTLFTKVSVRVLKAKQAVDTLDISSPGFSFHSLCHIPYIGNRIASKILNGMKHSPKNQEGVQNVLVRVKDHSVNKFPGDDLGYILTDSLGVAIIYLPSDGRYSFLPIHEGYEYGASKGTKHGPLGCDDITYEFRQKKHTIKPIDTQTFLRIKEEHLLSVRSPKDFKNALLFYPLMFFVAWWLFFIFILGYDLKKKTHTDYIVPLALMILSGIGLLAMFSIVDPLTDTLLGSTMAVGAILGIVFMALISLVDWGYFYSVGIRGNNTIIKFDFVLQFIDWISTPFVKKVQSFKIARNATSLQVIGYYLKLSLTFLLIPLELFFRLIQLLLFAFDWIAKKIAFQICKNPSERIKYWIRSPFNLNLPKGFGYILIALFFILLLYLFGDGPEGSNTKVNLFFFQPSELNKYLIVIFMAAFFAVRADRITLFSEVADSLNLRLQLKSVLLIILSLATLLALYMVVMSDMGPILVLLVTFIFLYSIARRDFKQLIIGIASFIGMIWLGGAINEGSVTSKFIFAVIWFLGWIIFWRIKEKKLYESAIFFNFLLSAFIFLGNFLAASNNDNLRNVGQRIVDRNEVAMNLWDNDVRGGGDQVVQGIWSLATGGFSGQGLGNGNPNLVPAFHTDMIFESIGEEMGWITLLLVILCLAVIIHRSLIIAYKTGNRFLFFLTSGIAIVTGVQFFVIILGSIGIIPLTGVAVPFLSFGMTSLIINLAAFGIVLSVSKINTTQNQREINRSYRYVTGVGIGTFLVVSIVLIAILFQYQVFPATRNKYLVKPAFVSNNEGYRLAEYNPRIRLLLKEMHAGNILDRNGLLLATSEKDRYLAFEDSLRLNNGNKSLYDILNDHLTAEHHRIHSRYYPFGNNTFFVLGDFNTQTLWGINEANPYGFLAEERLLGDLRGFTTSLTDENNRNVTVELESNNYYSSRFASPIDTSFVYNLKNYRPLIPYLKSGIHGRKVQSYNEKTERGDRDIYLTIDAKLQTLLQSKMNLYLNSSDCAYNVKSRPKLRASIVVLNAENGDVLSSSNYPLPNQDSIRKYQNLKIDYSKFEREWSNPVFTDRDLGATYFTNPGSTAKIMSSIAGFMKYGKDVSKQKYNVNSAEIIHGDNGSEPIGTVSMQQAIVNSSNCYFINLVNDKDLYPQLETLYGHIGARIDKPTFFLYENEIEEGLLNKRKEFLHSEVENMERNAVSMYNRYVERRAKGEYAKMRNQYWQWPWGQGTLDASPLAMARVASIVYNDGKLPETHWLYAQKFGKRIDYYKPSMIEILGKDDSRILKQYMKDESSSHVNLPKSMGGKTGTPGRDIKFSFSRKPINVNDGWYICFVETKAQNTDVTTGKISEYEPTPLAIAVRLERVGINDSKHRGGGSGLALSFVRNVVIPSLTDSGYIIE